MRNFGRIALIAIVTIISGISQPALAASADDIAGRQQEIDTILHGEATSSVASDRLMCATGIRAGMMATLDRAFDTAELPNRLADVCIASLDRSARDGQFSLNVRENSAPGALALDQAFMSAYQKHEPVMSDVPDIAILKPIAERCFANKEPRTGLCSATGYALGARIANGEAIRAG